MRRVKVTDSSGNVIGIYPSLSRAAKSITMSKASLLYRMRMGLPAMGKNFSYIDDDAPRQAGKLSKEEKERAKKEKRAKERSERESAKEVNVLMQEVAAREKGETVYRVPYELKRGVVCITPCSFREDTPENPRPMVGSCACVNCVNFKGKSRENRYVLCGFKFFQNQ